MLVILNDSLAEINPTDHASIAGLESVLAASHNGEHFLTSSFRVIHALLKLHLSAKGRSVLQRIRGSIALHGHLPYPESFVVEIIAKGTSSKQNSRHWLIPVTEFKNKAFPPSIVLGENMLDAKAYFSAAQQARVKHGRKEACNTVPDAGGGSQTAVKLQGYLTLANGYCFCITDGDYREPNGAKSAVTSSCEQLIEKTIWPAFATDFDARSIENIIPLELVEDSYGNVPPPKSFHIYKNIYETDKETARYIDVKEGLKYCGIAKMKIGTERYRFWWSKIEKHKLKSKYEEMSKKPPKCSENNCAECIIVNGLGGGILKQVVNYFGMTTAHKIAQRVNLNSTWCELGLNIFHWTIADKPAYS